MVVITLLVTTDYRMKQVEGSARLMGSAALYTNPLSIYAGMKVNMVSISVELWGIGKDRALALYVKTNVNLVLALN